MPKPPSPPPRALPPHSLPPLVGGLLVGGASRRMGRPKALVEWGGTTLAERAAAALAPHVERLVLLGDGPVPPALAHLPRLPDAPLAAAPPAPLSGSSDAFRGDDPDGAPRTARRPRSPADTPADPAAEPLSEAPAVPPLAGSFAGPLAALLAALRAEPEAAWLLCPCDLPAVRPEAVAWLVGERRPERLAVIVRREPGAPPEPLLAVYEPAIRPAVEALAAAGGRAPRLLTRLDGVAVLVPPPGLAACWRDADRPEDLPAG